MGKSNLGPELKQAFLDYYLRLKDQAVPPFTIEFYPYRNLSHTIRARQGKVLVRISDILADAPAEVLKVTLGILLHKLFCKPVPESQRRMYRSYVNTATVCDKVREVRKARGKKYLGSPIGRVFDLRGLFDQLNRRYFGGRLCIHYLSWSRSENRRSLGHYDSAHQAIVLNRRLDRSSIPQFVVEYVLYHEMLHAFLGEKNHNGRRQIHHRLFRKAEQEFSHYVLAREYTRCYL